MAVELCGAATQRLDKPVMPIPEAMRRAKAASDGAVSSQSRCPHRTESRRIGVTGCTRAELEGPGPLRPARASLESHYPDTREAKTKALSPGRILLTSHDYVQAMPLPYVPT